MDNISLQEIQKFIDSYDLTGKTDKDIIGDYQKMLQVVEELVDNGVIDRRKASELKLSLHEAHQEHGTKIKEFKKEKNDFTKTMEAGGATDTEFADYVNSMKDDIDKELENGLFEQEEKRSVNERVEKGDGNFIM